MQQDHQSPLNQKHRASSLHSLLNLNLNLSPLSPLRTLLARAHTPPPPLIPQIHPSEYETYKSITHLLSTFTSHSIARARRANSLRPPPSPEPEPTSDQYKNQNKNKDTYRSIHCGDQACCFATPYTHYRPRRPSSHKSPKPTLSLPPRPRSLSNPNLRRASTSTAPTPKPEISSSNPDPASLHHHHHHHPYRRTLRSAGSAKRANSLFGGSPPPVERVLRPLYEYPAPIGARSASWVGGEREREREREREMETETENGYRRSGLGMFSWTVQVGGGDTDIDADIDADIDVDGGRGEREIAYEWDGAFGWMRACRDCGRERCVRCGGEVFEQVVGERERVTAVGGMFSVCTPCGHGFCPGTKLWLRVRCGGCGEVGCEGCEGCGGGEVVRDGGL